MKRIRGGSGLGDSLYIRPIAQWLLDHGEQVTVCSDYPEVFFGMDVLIEPFGRERIDILAHYTNGKYDTSTNQWQDICRNAGIATELHIDWTVRNAALVEKLRDMANGRRIIVVHGGRAPMGRKDGFGMELLPESNAFHVALAALQDCMLVRIGKGEEIYKLPADIDLSDSTSISDLIDIGSICDGIIAQCSFAIPLAEAFDKPLLTVWAARGMEAERHPYIRAITPKKILSKPSSIHVVDDWPMEQIQEKTKEWAQRV